MAVTAKEDRCKLARLGRDWMKKFLPAGGLLTNGNCQLKVYQCSPTNQLNYSKDNVGRERYVGGFPSETHKRAVQHMAHPRDGARERRNPRCEAIVPWL